MRINLQRALESQIEGKAIGPIPQFRDGVPTSVYSPGATRQDAKISQREAMRHSQAFGGDQAIDWVYDCINLYSDPISTAPWRLEKDDGTKLIEQRTDGTPPEHKLGPKELYELLRKPNPFMLWDELVTLLIEDVLLVGNGYWFKWRTTSDGKPLALYRLAPAYVKIIPGPFGAKRYEYQPPGAKDPLNIDPKNLIHFKRPNPHSAYYGLGVIQGGGRAFDLELALTDTIASYYENKADPSLIIESERRVSRDVFNKLRAQLRARVSGSKKAGELLVLEAGLKANNLSPTARDALFDDLARMSRDRILTKFRVFPDLLGVTDEAQAADILTEHRREFDNATLRPFITKLQAQITDSLVAAWGCKLIIDYRYQMPIEDIVKMGTDFAAVPGIKVREVRQFFAPLGIEESTGDPEIDELVLNVPGENMGPDGQPLDGNAALADRPLGSEPGRPPKGTNTGTFGSGGATPAGAKVRKPRPQGKALTDDITERWKALQTEGTTSIGNKLKHEDRTEGPRTTDIDATAAFIADGLDNAVHTLERGLLDHTEGKASRGDLLKRLRNSKSWVTFQNMITSVLEDGAQRAASSAVMHQADLGHVADEDIPYDEIARSVVHRPEGIRAIVSNLKNRVLKSVKSAQDEIGDAAALRDAVQETLRDWRTGQAAVIADSEATHAYNEGTLTVAETLGLDEVGVLDGHDHDEPCREADGQTWPISFARENRIEHPNCRRAFVLSPATA